MDRVADTDYFIFFVYQKALIHLMRREVIDPVHSILLIDADRDMDAISSQQE